MARQTRQQRRERRTQTGERPAPQPVRRAVPVPAADGAGSPPRRPPTATSSGGGRFSFFGESYGELKKVEWPNQKQVLTGTAAVLLACLVVGVYLFANDLVWKHVVKWLI
jgi:preprotein translocase subunit SecE